MRERSPGCLTHVVLFIVIMTAVYYWQYPKETVGDLSEMEERHFYVAVVQRTGTTGGTKIVPVSLARLKSGELDTRLASFLLPAGEIRVPVDHDHHYVKVLEGHPEWQVIEYHYENTRQSVSRYRAFERRIEPLSYRAVSDVGLAFAAILVLIPVALTGALINWIWKRVVRSNRGSSDV